MNTKTNGAAVCSECGAKMLNSINVCPECGDTAKVTWGKESDRLKLLWVIATVFFWFSACFQGALFVMNGTLNMVLLSVIGGMMVLGVVLKLRYQRHLRKKPQD